MTDKNSVVSDEIAKGLKNIGWRVRHIHIAGHPHAYGAYKGFYDLSFDSKTAWIFRSTDRWNKMLIYADAQEALKQISDATRK